VTEIGTQSFEDIYEPLEEGLDRLVFKKQSTSFIITLSKDPIDSKIDKNHYGY